MVFKTFKKDFKKLIFVRKAIHSPKKVYSVHDWGSLVIVCTIFI